MLQMKTKINGKTVWLNEDSTIGHVKMNENRETLVVLAVWLLCSLVASAGIIVTLLFVDAI